jgi:hypothetical protein
MCKAQCYNISEDDPCDVERVKKKKKKKKKKKIPVKVVWYFLVIPRLKHLFRCRANAKMMRWHKEERKKDDKSGTPLMGCSGD